MPKWTEVELDTVAGGAAPERFAHLMGELIENIMDPNTDAETKRSIKLVFDFEPYETRNGAKVTLKSSVNLAPPKELTAQMHLGKRDGRLVALVNDPGQGNLFDDDDEGSEDESDVVPLDPRKEA